MRDTQREAEMQAEREAGSLHQAPMGLMWDSILAPRDHVKGRCSTTEPPGVPSFEFLMTFVFHTLYLLVNSCSWIFNNINGALSGSGNSYNGYSQPSWAGMSWYELVAGHPRCHSDPRRNDWVQELCLHACEFWFKWKPKDLEAILKSLILVKVCAGPMRAMNLNVELAI